MIKIILKKNIKNLGIKYDLITVKSGYALNYLIPQKYAIIATKSQIKINNQILKQKKNKDKLLINKYKKFIILLKKKIIKFNIKITDTVFLIITKKIILNKIKKNNIIIDKKDINFNKIVIKKYGKYKIDFILKNNLKGYFNIKVDDIN
ncbi:MAG: 50S ribosomal protein L9 [Candidatus Shikimatogenerans bostrichidophilus]|nr:MAG: 50S ribosomal protein L9 [Candidatus Shikimatogenerans bostrichidophilus]